MSAATARAHRLWLLLGDGDGILLTLILLLAVVRVDDAQYNEQYGRVVEVREHDEEPPQHLRLALGILWTLRQLSNRLGCGLGGSDEPVSSGYGDG